METSEEKQRRIYQQMIDRIPESVRERINVKHEKILWILGTINYIQERMKRPDLVNAEYIRVYATLSEEDETRHFFDSQPKIFKTVIEGRPLGVVMQALYFHDKVLRGLISEDALQEELAKQMLTPEQYNMYLSGKERLASSGKL